ncbi:MAG: YbbR-like domain-containing protein [Bacteroides sp.]|nr:YbbR-like domain-containing protein [Bacteroides sp.]
MGVGQKLDKAKVKWRGMKTSTGFHNFVLFLACVAVATVFWIVMSLNDSVTSTFDIELKIENVPDSVTFINDPPETFHATLRDKGTNIMRSGLLGHPKMTLNFRDYASDGIFKVTQSDVNAAMKHSFGGTSQIVAISLDSLYLHYTTHKGRRVPIVVVEDVTAIPGMIVCDACQALQKSALLYSYEDNVDTITRVYTQPIIKRNLKETTEVTVALKPIAGVKMVPSTIKVKIPVEPLVKKEGMATVSAMNVPSGEDLLLFPNRVQVEYYVPMSLFNADVVPVDIVVDYNDIYSYQGSRIPVSIHHFADYVESPKVLADSVEYTLVKQ